jgi:radical SAM protein with 4Fe4S-binding SPASM domain
LERIPLLARLYQEAADRGLLLLPGNNIGYFGPYESLLRGSGDDRVYWTSCNAGKNTLGIEADGTIKGCPSLPTSPYAGGNVRDLSLDYIWWKTDELSINRTRTNDELWGFCRGCYYADVCKAGCTWTTHVLFGRAGNNPYCHHRALEFSKQGLRERIVQVEEAPGIPFDHGRFELIVEAADGRNPAPVLAAGSVERQLISTVGGILLSGNALVQIAPARKLGDGKKQPKGNSAVGWESLILCRGCQRHVRADTKVCPFCERDVRALAKLHDETMQEAQNAYLRLVELLSNPMI